MTGAPAAESGHPQRRRADTKPGRRRTLLVAGAIALLAVALYQTLRPIKPRLTTATPIEVRAEPIRHFSRRDTSRSHFGQLAFRGGLVLTSPHPAFGGWSALALGADGHLLAISDTGVWMTADLGYRDRAPVHIANARIGPLLGGDGQPFARGRDRDSEGVTLVSGSLREGEVLVSFEQHHRIARYPVSAEGLGTPKDLVPLPAEAGGMSLNRGLEAICRVGTGPLAGSLLALAERLPHGATGAHTGWITADAGSPVASAWRRFEIDVVDGFDITDCHGLPDGSVLVLERRFRIRDWLGGPRMQLRRFTATGLVGGARLSGEVLLQAGPDEDIDNMEGLAVHTDDTGDTVVTIISDDNFNPILQRTVLLQFALPSHR